MTDKKYILKIEGQEPTIPPKGSGLEDADLKRALTPCSQVRPTRRSNGPKKMRR